MVPAKLFFGFVGVCFSTLCLNFSAMAAWPRKVSVCAAQLTSMAAQSSPNQTKEAIHSLRRFRFEALRQAGVDPTINELQVHETLPAENYGSATILADEESVAGQIRGIEEHARNQLQGLRPELSGEAPATVRARQNVKVSGLRLKGQAEIEKFIADLRDFVDSVENIADAARIHELIHFMFGGAGLWVLGDFAIPQMVNMAQGDPVSAFFLPGAAGVFLMGPDAVVRIVRTRDYGFERQMKRLSRSRNEQEWAYDSHAYEVHNSIVSSISHARMFPHGDVQATVKLDAQPYWNLWASRQLAKLKMKLDSTTSLAGRTDFENQTRKVWVQIDRARFYEDGEPVLVMVVRTSEAQPRF